MGPLPDDGGGARGDRRVRPGPVFCRRDVAGGVDDGAPPRSDCCAAQARPPTRGCRLGEIIKHIIYDVKTSVSLPRFPCSPTAHLGDGRQPASYRPGARRGAHRDVAGAAPPEGAASAGTRPERCDNGPGPGASCVPRPNRRGSRVPGRTPWSETLVILLRHPARRGVRPGAGVKSQA